MVLLPPDVATLELVALVAGLLEPMECQVLVVVKQALVVAQVPVVLVVTKLVGVVEAP